MRSEEDRALSAKESEARADRPWQAQGASVAAVRRYAKRIPTAVAPFVGTQWTQGSQGTNNLPKIECVSETRMSQNVS